MKLISGTARNVRRAAGTEALTLDLDGHGVHLDTGESSLAEDGDDLIVAGPQEAGVVIGYAYRNITRGHGHRASCQEDAKNWVVSVLFFALGIWAALSPPSDLLPLPWTQHIAGSVFALGWAIGIIRVTITIAQKFLAWFRVNCAAIETVKGKARNVRLSQDHRAAHFDVDAHQVKLEMPGEIVIADGDEVAVAAQRAGAVLVGMDYSNMTRSAGGRSWMAFRPLSQLLLHCVLLVTVVSGGFGVNHAPAIFVLLGRVLSFVLVTGILISALDRFFRWRLTLEASRRARAAGGMDRSGTTASRFGC
jgi:hypothetical protein